VASVVGLAYMSPSMRNLCETNPYFLHISSIHIWWHYDVVCWSLVRSQWMKLNRSRQQQKNDPCMCSCVFCAFSPFIDAEKVTALSYFIHSFSNSTYFRSGNDGLLKIIAGTSVKRETLVGLPGLWYCRIPSTVVSPLCTVLAKSFDANGWRCLLKIQLSSAAVSMA
jgi:hypothetical protein